MTFAIGHSTRSRCWLLGICGITVASGARASNPLEYPDNGAASFARGGAWLAVASEPIAAHYNPAALATLASSLSIEQQLNFRSVCYDRRGPGGTPEGPAAGIEYLPVCNTRRGFPAAIPSISIAWRASDRVGLGFALVPPATYGIPSQSLPVMQPGYHRALDDCLAGGRSPDVCGGASPHQPVPAPYRYQVLEQQSTLLFPTASVGIEIASGLRLGVGFIAGLAAVNTQTAAVTTESVNATADSAADDSISTLRTRDWFIPGVVVAAHWSVTRHLDLAVWGRWIDAIESSKGELTAVTRPYTTNLTQLQPTCRVTDPECDTTGTTGGVENRFGDEGLRHFRYPYPPEVRAGVRFHWPYTAEASRGPNEVPSPHRTRDPLRDDVFDVELDGSLALNSLANTIEVRFPEQDGIGVVPVLPTGFLPPNADRYNGYKDSWGVRLGGQVTLVRARLAVRTGTWFETESQDPRWLQVGVVGATRGGFGGGVVIRQSPIDLSLGYQRHWSLGLDNHGRGAMRTVVSANNYDLDDEPPGVSAADRTQFRTARTVNNGRVTQSAHAFSLGATVQF